MNGFNRWTGKTISDWDRCAQAIEVILTTRLNQRVMRLWFGSEMMDLMDRPMNQQLLVDAVMAAAEPINAWEPEFKIEGIELTEAGPDGRMKIYVDGVYLPDETKRRVTVDPLIPGALPTEP